MAEFISTTFGQISGKHGTAVAVVRDGKNYIRKFTKPTDRKTPKQIAQRAKFAYTNKTLSIFKSLFEETFPNKASRSTARSHAFKNAITGTYPNFEVDYNELKLSSGSLSAGQEMSIVLEDGAHNLNWEYLKTSNSSEDDSLNAIIYEPVHGSILHLTDIALRYDLSAELDIPSQLENKKVHVWIYYSNGKSKSNSMYLGEYLF